MITLSPVLCTYNADHGDVSVDHRTLPAFSGCCFLFGCEWAESADLWKCDGEPEVTSAANAQINVSHTCVFHWAPFYCRCMETISIFIVYHYLKPQTVMESEPITYSSYFSTNARMIKQPKKIVVAIISQTETFSPWDLKVKLQPLNKPFNTRLNQNLPSKLTLVRYQSSLLTNRITPYFTSHHEGEYFRAGPADENVTWVAMWIR